MVVWRGLGLLVPSIVLACFGAEAGAFDLLGISQDGNPFPRGAIWPLSGPLAVSGAICLVLKLATSGPVAPDIDRSTGPRIPTDPRHGVYGLPIAIWGALLLAAGAIAHARLFG